jgi:hypothetical protein
VVVGALRQVVEVVEVVVGPTEAMAQQPYQVQSSKATKKNWPAAFLIAVTIALPMFS